MPTEATSPRAARPEASRASLRRGLHLALAASLGLNLVFLAASGVWVARKGGPRYVMEQLGLVRTTFQPAAWQVDQVERFRQLPDTEEEVVFAGDSITAAMPWAEFYSDVRNRGLGGDTSDGLLKRLDEIVESRPRQVFVNIGTNDLAREVPVDQVADNVEAIVARIGRASPETKIHLVSVLPINLNHVNDVRTRKKHADIPRLNARLAAIAGQTPATFIDLFPEFADARGFLRAELTTDGLHLSPAGERLYGRLLRPYVRSRELDARREASAKADR